MNINETTKTISGEVKTWDRAKEVIINNAYGNNPIIRFIDERITVSPTDVKSFTLPILVGTMSKPTEEFDLLHPETGEKIGVGKYQDIQVLLYSLYVKLKNEAVLKKLADSD